MEICSIGSSAISAKEFFESLRGAKVTSIIDTRLNAESQLAGFTKKSALAYLAPALLGVPYLHETLLAPEATALKAYRNGKLEWDSYAQHYLKLLDQRDLANTLDTQEWGERPVFLCSEPESEHCHRRLAAEYLLDRREDVTGIYHLRQ